MVDANGTNKFIKIGGFVLSCLVAITAVIFYVTGAFADQKDWTQEQDRVVEQRLETKMEDQYVPRHRFTPVEQNIKDIKQSLQNIDEKIDRLQRRGDDV